MHDRAPARATARTTAPAQATWRWVHDRRWWISCHDRVHCVATRAFGGSGRLCRDKNHMSRQGSQASREVWVVTGTSLLRQRVVSLASRQKRLRRDKDGVGTERLGWR